MLECGPSPEDSARERALSFAQVPGGERYFSRFPGACGLSGERSRCRAVNGAGGGRPGCSTWKHGSVVGVAVFDDRVADRSHVALHRDDGVLDHGQSRFDDGLRAPDRKRPDDCGGGDAHGDGRGPLFEPVLLADDLANRFDDRFVFCVESFDGRRFGVAMWAPLFGRFGEGP